MAAYPHFTSWAMSGSGRPMSSATTIIGRRLAMAPIHSMHPSCMPSTHSRSAACTVNCSITRIRLAAK
ncbi:Uncharacterised protein [Mycobacterium tuberculosis]|nr:Uncharacterised protein [Mycobacterium tuberculosis]